MAFPLGGGWWFISPSTKLLLLVIIWWGSSAAFSVLSKMVLKNAVASTAVALSTLHLLMSATYFAISVAARGLDASAMVWSCLWVGMLQGLGNVSTYLLLLFSSVSRTQILKATEPLFLAVAIFSLPVNSSEKLSKWKALGFLVTVAGVILSSWHPNSKHIPHLAILSSMVANSSFGLRTVLMKMLHATQTLESSIHPVDMFGASCAVGSILSALLLCIAMLWSPSLEFKLIPEIFAQSLFPIIGSGVFFLMYNMASFALLGELSCLKWSLLKSGKLVIVVVAENQEQDKLESMESVTTTDKNDMSSKSYENWKSDIEEDSAATKTLKCLYSWDKTSKKKYLPVGGLFPNDTPKDGTWPLVFKWKPPQFNSIDFYVHVKTNDLVMRQSKVYKIFTLMRSCIKEDSEGNIAPGDQTQITPHLKIKRLPGVRDPRYPDHSPSRDRRSGHAHIARDVSESESDPDTATVAFGCYSDSDDNEVKLEDTSGLDWSENYSDRRRPSSVDYGKTSHDKAMISSPVKPLERPVLFKNWVFNTGATQHLTSNSSLLKNIRPLRKPIVIRTASKVPLLCTHSGTARILGNDGSSCEDLEIHLVDQIKTNQRLEEEKCLHKYLELNKIKFMGSDLAGLIIFL
eukprot:gene13030-3490_t